VRFYAVSTCLPPAVATDSLPSPIEVMALAHDAISFSAVGFMCSGTLRNVHWLELASFCFN
jgi:hypothetical protein